VPKPAASHFIVQRAQTRRGILAAVVFYRPVVGGTARSLASSISNSTFTLGGMAMLTKKPFILT
jgi:hypothetical protein